MGWWLASADDQVRRDWMKRFDARFWTVDFPRPMMAAVTTTAPDALRVDAVFYGAGDLAGLIWESADRFDHPLLSYETARDYRGLKLRFRWQSAGVLPLDAVYGPVLTIEGRDAGGVAQTWYVRLWNYATGTGTDAQVVLPFSALGSGFALPGAPVWAGDIDRMFISLVPAGYTGAISPLPAPVEGWAALSGIACDGAGATILVGDAYLPEHGLRIASGYDDSYNLTPARVLRQAQALGYRGYLNHYLGMSHFMRLGFDVGTGKYLAGGAGSPLNVAAAAWHRDLLARAGAMGFAVILSASYELFDAHAPDAWKQRAWDGSAAQTGYSPPSTLLSPANADAMAYLRRVGGALAGLAVAAGQPVHFQVGEPWWWVGADGKPCVYDAGVTAAYAATGRALPPAVTSAGAVLSAEQAAYFDWAGHVLGASTLALRDAVRAAVAGSRTYLLFFTPQVVNANAANLMRLNLPGEWAWPAFDVLQLEDYDFVTAGNDGAAAVARAAVQARLGYPVANQQYFAGFATRAGDAVQWGRIADAAGAAAARGIGDIFIWALPQVARDGFTYFRIGDPVDSFDDVSFPLAIGQHASVSPAFFTQIVTSASGHEQRNAQWAAARLRFDAGLGLRSDGDLGALMSFFRARRGSAVGFRFRDPLDQSSADLGAGGVAGPPGAFDQVLGTGDGVQTAFALMKAYDPVSPARRITRPVAGSVTVAVGGAVLASGWHVGSLGVVQFDVAPATGATVSAGYSFDVPVRFESDALDVSLAAFRQGELLSVPLIEVKEG